MNQGIVTQQKQDALAKKMQTLEIFESDIQEQFIRSQGKGGQNVNKVATCVRLKHLPTGIEVKCQRTRSQNQNRFFARRLLVKKIENIILGEKSAEAKRVSKIRAQKRKRSKRAKEKVLAAKKQIAQKKVNRKSVNENIQ